MFELYTEKARRSIFFARLEASKLGSAWIGPEHLFLGLIHENEGILKRFSNADLGNIRQEIADMTPRQETAVSTSVDMPLSHQAKRVLTFCVEDARELNHARIDTEHLLLGLLRVRESPVTDLLGRYGIDHAGVMREISGNQAR